MESGVFKYTPSEKANRKIDNDMKIIVREIRKKIPTTLSIILTGGFSRGEGPVKIEGNNVYPCNDYDIQVITQKPVSKKDADKISIEVSKKIGYRGIINFYPFRKEEQKLKENFYIDLKCDSVSELKKLLPRIRTYELKNHSRILYGKDYRELIPDYDLREIPLSEGAKLLLDRMSQMIEYYSTEKKHEPLFLNYIIQQAYAACCTSLLLLNKKYEIGYLKSAKILKKCYKRDFPELYKKSPDLHKKIEQFILWKSNPKKPSFKDVEKEWFIAKQNILEVAKYFFSRFLNKKISNSDELADSILHMRREFYFPYLRKIIKSKTGIKSSAADFLTFLTIPFVGAVLKYKYYKRLKEEFKINKPSVFFNPSPDLVIFSSLIYFIDSINKGNKIDFNKLKKGQKLLRKVYPSEGGSWEEISLDYANAYISFFLQKIV